MFHPVSYNTPPVTSPVVKMCVQHFKPTYSTASFVILWYTVIGAYTTPKIFCCYGRLQFGDQLDGGIFSRPPSNQPEAGGFDPPLLDQALIAFLYLYFQWVVAVAYWSIYFLSLAYQVYVVSFPFGGEVQS